MDRHESGGRRRRVKKEGGGGLEPPSFDWAGLTIFLGGEGGDGEQLTRYSRTLMCSESAPAAKKFCITIPS